MTTARHSIPQPAGTTLETPEERARRFIRLLDEARAAIAASGMPQRSAEEIDRDIRWLRGDD